MARLKYELKAAPAYTYYFKWQSPMLEDAGAWDTAELQFCFAWAVLLQSGKPELPWAATDPVSNKTMIFDNQCAMAEDPDGEARKIILA